MGKYRLLTGKHIHKGKKYRAGDIITCNQEDISGFLSRFEIVEEDKKPELPQEKTHPLQIKRVFGSRYNVINTGTGTPINDKPLLKAEALELIKFQ